VSSTGTTDLQDCTGASPPEQAHLFWRFYGPPDLNLYDDRAIKELRNGACVRSGNCCIKAPCHLALERGETRGPCGFLRGNEPGGYSCALVNGEEGRLTAQEAADAMAIGEGCCSNLNTDRLTAGQNLTISRRGAGRPDEPTTP
jgi:hypothetical protein